jgi:hypothetical protein
LLLTTNLTASTIKGGVSGDIYLNEELAGGFGHKIEVSINNEFDLPFYNNIEGENPLVSNHLMTITPLEIKEETASLLLKYFFKGEIKDGIADFEFVKSFPLPVSLNEMHKEKLIVNETTYIEASFLVDRVFTKEEILKRFEDMKKQNETK